MVGKQLALEAKGDLSVYALIAANLLALAIAWASHMSLRDLMVVYWIQSVIIGLTHFVRILALRKFAVGRGEKYDDPETTATKLKYALFFLLHYGIFHLAYVYIAYSVHLEKGQAPVVSGASYLLCALVFAVNHIYSLLQNARRDALGKPNLGTLMFLPYARILPMHLVILTGGSFSGGTAFLLFGALKIVADVVMHTVEYRVLSRGSQPEVQR